jgi:UDP-glucose 4-epimerase
MNAGAESYGDGASRVLVLGGAGFLGSHVARRFAALGARVTIVDAMFTHGGANRANLRGLPPSVEVIECDISALPDLERHLAAADLVVDAMGATGHQWASRYPDLDLASNVSSHLVLLQSLQALQPGKSRPRIVHLGTRAVYGRGGEESVDEQRAPAPIDIQGSHKLLAERHLTLLGSQMCLTTTVLRIGNCYGPGQRLSGDDVGLLGGFLRQIMAGGSAVVFGGSERQRDFLFVDDVTDAVLAAAAIHAPGTHIFNIAGRRVPLTSVVNELIAAAGRGSSEMAEFPDEVKRIDPGAFVLDCTRAERTLGWTPKTPLALGIGETVRYYALHGQDYGVET